jgi:beta-lactamase regulating signal transducer with metallopeptidase domain/flagellar motor protein MotB
MHLAKAGQWIEALFGWAWRTTLEASVLIALVILLQWLFARRLRPNFQYALWMLVLFRLSLPAAPASGLSILNLFARVPAQPLVHGHGALSTSTAASTESTKVSLPVSDTVQGFPNTDSPSLSTVAAASWSGGVADTGIPVRAEQQATARLMLGTIWFVGALVLLLATVIRHWRFAKWIRAEETVADGRTLALLEQCRVRLGTTGRVRPIATNKFFVPAIFGFWKPNLILPTSVMRDLNERELRMIFLHELAHVKRGDIFWNWAIIMVRAIHWFNPLVWFAMRRLQADRELACDAMVVSRLNSEEITCYGQALIKLAKGFSAVRFCPTLTPAIHHKREIKRRITMIAQFKPANRMTTVLSIAVLITVCCLTFTRAAEKEQAESPRKNRDAIPAQSPSEAGRQSIKALEDRVSEQHKRVSQQQASVDKLRQELKVDESDTAPGPRFGEPETVKTLERIHWEGQAQAAHYASLSKQFTEMSRAGLRNALPTVFPGQPLNELLSKLSTAENELVLIASELGNDHPKRQALSALVTNLDTQVEAQVDGILAGLKLVANAHKARVEELEKSIDQKRVEDAAKMVELRPYFEAKRDLEAQTRTLETLKLRLLQEQVDAIFPVTRNRIREELGKTFLQSPEFRENRSLRIELTPDGLTIDFLDRPERPIFEPDSGALTEFGKWIVNTVAWEIRRYPQREIELAGHTLKSQLRTDDEAWKLSNDRANTLRKRLYETGVQQSQIKKVISYGATQPLPGADPKDPINNRVTLLIKAE